MTTDQCSPDSEAPFIGTDEDACRFIASVSWPLEREGNRDGWAVTMLDRPDLLALEIHRARARLEAAIARVASLAQTAESDASSISEEWVEWGVRRTWGPEPGSVATMERDRRTAEKCAREWPGELVSRLVAAGQWTRAIPAPMQPAE